VARARKGADVLRAYVLYVIVKKSIVLEGFLCIFLALTLLVFNDKLLSLIFDCSVRSRIHTGIFFSVRESTI
jgi:hypothetical protein